VDDYWFCRVCAWVLRVVVGTFADACDARAGTSPVDHVAERGAAGLAGRKPRTDGLMS